VRLVRRLGGVRRAIVRGITLAGARRRAPPSLTTASQTSRDHAAARHPEASVPSRVLLPHRPRLLARLLTRRQRSSASVSRPTILSQGDTPFTPEAFPQLSPKACAVLNTPLKDCDPKTLELVLSAFTRHITEIMSPEAGITDRKASLPNLWHRISTALADTNADTSLPATPQAVPAVPADAAPDAPVASPHPPSAPTGPSAKDAPRLSPLPQSGSPADAAISAAVTADPSTGRSPTTEGLMTDQQWQLIEPFLTTLSSQGGRPPRNHRRVLDGILWICRTGASWRDLPQEFGNWNAVWRQYRRWCLSGVWDVVLQALSDSGGDLDTLQMIDSTTIRPHRCAAGEKGRFAFRCVPALARARLH
jgi:transposase